MSARKSKVVKVNISAGTYKDEAEAVKEANAIKRWLIRYCDKNGYSVKGKVWISTNSAYAGTIIIKGRKKKYVPNGKPLPTVVEAHIHMVLFCNPASTIVEALKSYLNKKHMKAVVWDKHCNSRAEVENAVEYAMRQSIKVRTIDYDRKDVLSVDEWGYYEAVAKAEAKIKEDLSFTKSVPEKNPETLENKSVSSISNTPETLTCKSIIYNDYNNIVPASYSFPIFSSLLQMILNYTESSTSTCSKNIFKKVLLKVLISLKNLRLYAIIIVYDEFSIGDMIMKQHITLDDLKVEARVFCDEQSKLNHVELIGVTDGKAVGTYVEHRFQNYLNEKYEIGIGSSAKGIDLPDDEIMTDIKVTSITQPQSSCPFKNARQKIYGLGYNLLVFVYEKHDTHDTCTLNFKYCTFINNSRTADFTITKRLREMIDDGANKEDIIGFLIDKNVPGDEIIYNDLADEILTTKPEQGYLTISNALQWRLQYGRVIALNNSVEGVLNYEW